MVTPEKQLNESGNVLSIVRPTVLAFVLLSWVALFGVGGYYQLVNQKFAPLAIAVALLLSPFVFGIQRIRDNRLGVR